MMFHTLRSTTRQAWVLVLASLASFMVALDALVVTTALSTIRRDLGVSIDALEWTVNAYILSLAVLLIPAAALGDRFGRRRLFVAGLGLFAAASAACALAPSVGWLIAARAVQGSGAAVVTPLALTLLSAAFPLEQRARALGIFGSLTGLALIAGPVVGGAIAQGLAWQWIFWLNVPIGLLVIALSLLRIEESFGPRTALDLGGLLLVAGASLGLVWGLVRGNSVGWGSLEVIGTLVTGALLAAAFMIWERRTPAPMVPMRFFGSRAFSAGNAANFLLNASIIGTVFFMAQFLQTAQGYGPLGAGLRLLPWTATLFVVAPIAGSLVNQVGERLLIVGGLALQAAGMAWIGLIAAPHLPYIALVTPLIIMGAGVSLAIAPTENAVISTVAVNDIGKASGAFNMVSRLGAAFGVAILAAIFGGVGSFHSPQTFSNGFVAALRMAAALSLLGALAGLVLPSRRERVFAQAQAQVEATDWPLAPRLPVRVRPFVPADRAFVLSLAPRLTEGVAPWIGAARMRKTVEQALAADIEAMSESSTILVAEGQDGRRLGFLTISCQRHYTGLAEAYVRNLAVLEQAQRLGVGTTLIEAAVAWVKSRSMEYVGLHTGVRNSGARAFYERLGFVEESVKLVKPVWDSSPP